MKAKRIAAFVALAVSFAQKGRPGAIAKFRWEFCFEMPAICFGAHVEPPLRMRPAMAIKALSARPSSLTREKNEAWDGHLRIASPRAASFEVKESPTARFQAAGLI